MEDYEDLHDQDVFESMNDHLEYGQCGRCMKKQERPHFHEIVYSQGTPVCLPCKEITQAGDNRAFDRDMALR